MFRLFFPNIPSAKEIADEVWKTLKNTFSNIKSTLGKVKSEVENFPNTIATAFDNAKKESEKVWDSAKLTVDHAEQSIKHTGQFLDQLSAEYNSWSKTQETQFQNELTHFFDGLVKVAEELPNVLASLKFDIDKSMHPQIAAIINATPGVILWGLDRALAPVPSWHTLPDELLKTLKKLPHLEGPPETICPKIMQPGMPEPWEIHRVRTMLRLIMEAMDVAKEVVPKDLSVTAVAVAGGGTEAAGHPAKWPFLLAKEIFKLVDWLLTRYLEEYTACHASGE